MIASLQTATAQATANVSPETVSVAGTGDLLRMVLSLFAVIVMILVIAWLTRRLQARAHSGTRHLRCVESLAVGMKERILLIEAGEQQLLVGLSPSGLQTLLVLDQPLSPSVSPPPSEPPSFRQILTQWRSP